MKKLFYYSLIFACTAFNNISAQSFEIHPFDKQMSFISMDHNQTSLSTLIEYDRYLVLIELPFSDAGGSRHSQLQENRIKAEALSNFLEQQYPGKPVKLVLSSHWHLHSLSGISPFLEKGATLVTAKSNWEFSLKNNFLDPLLASKLRSKICMVTGDTTLLKKTQNPIQVLFLDSSYTNKPTRDYLFFYLPTSKTLHASCMLSINQVDLKQKKRIIYSDRLTDVQKSFQTRKLPLDRLITLSTDTDSSYFKAPIYSATYFSQYIKEGKAMSVVMKDLMSTSLSDLLLQRGIVLQELKEQQYSSSLINSLVYRCIAAKQYAKAVAWSEILNLYSPGDLHYIDTMGEANYCAGNMVMARHYDDLLHQKDPKTELGLLQWEANNVAH